MVSQTGRWQQVEVHAVRSEVEIEASALLRKATGRDPERSRRILIEATLKTLAEDGLSDTTVSRIIRRAGLSRGMIHLHFGGKDKLVTAAAETFAGRYYDEIERQLEGKQDTPAELILTVIKADLSKEVLNEESVAIWHALRGAARFSNGIAHFSDTRDRRLRTMIYNAFQHLHEESRGKAAHAYVNDATLGTLALLEGMWTDYMVHPGSFSRRIAIRIVTRFVSGQFPGNIPLNTK